MGNDHRIFTGSNQQQPENLAKLPESPPPWRDFSHSINRQQRGVTYQASPDEIEMVNAALLLRRPLLITGKPGTGKSSLAHAVAYELGLGDVLTWPITSKSTLQHGLYHYDALARLQDASLAKSATPFKGRLAKPSFKSTSNGNYDIGRYLHLGAIGTAFVQSEPQKPRVVLIDELDKSDIDLPNDLLHLFEEGEFSIPELARLSGTNNVKVYGYGTQDKLDVPSDGIIRCGHFPLVIMTSNGEREFPPAFLRRCLRLKMAQPNEEKLRQIAMQHLGQEAMQANGASEIITKFLTLRDTENREIATDQLLNALYLVTQGIELSSDDKSKLQQAIFAALTES